MPTKRKPMLGLRAIITDPECPRDTAYLLNPDQIWPRPDAFLDALNIGRRLFGSESIDPFRRVNFNALVAPRTTALLVRWARLRYRLAEPRRRVREAVYVLKHGPREEDW